jgi:hypothetical protein
MRRGLEGIKEGIAADMLKKLPYQRKTQRENLSEAIATILHVQTVNTSEIAAGLPRKAERMDMRYQWLLRLLDNPHIIPEEVMVPYAQEILVKLRDSGETIVLIMDQTHINKTFEMVMIGVRFNNRALPLSWVIRETQGSIGFEEQACALNVVSKWIPYGSKVVLMGDRAYGTPALIEWCQTQGWDYRLRLKGIIKTYKGIKPIPAHALPLGAHPNIPITSKGIHTNLGIIHEPGHPEPWIIAMSVPANDYKTLDYGLRWGIEAMFSDFKTRGFSLESSQMKLQSHLDRLILMVSIALYWGVSTGHWVTQNETSVHQKKLQTSAIL